MMPSTTNESTAPESRAHATSTLLIMTLNEIDGMRVIMPQIKKEWVDQTLILEGGSTDGTLEYALENGYETYVQKDRVIRTVITRSCL